MVPAHVLERLMRGEPPVLVWREHRGLSRDDLARRAGVSPAELAAIESGAAEGSLPGLTALAAALGLDLDDLVPWPQEDRNQP